MHAIVVTLLDARWYISWKFQILQVFRFTLILLCVFSRVGSSPQQYLPSRLATYQLEQTNGSGFYYLIQDSPSETDSLLGYCCQYCIRRNEV